MPSTFEIPTSPRLCSSSTCQRQCDTSSGSSFFPNRLHIMYIALVRFGTRDTITAGKSGDVLHEHVYLAFSYSCIVELPFSATANPGKLLGSSYVAGMTQQSYLIGIYGQKKYVSAIVQLRMIVSDSSNAPRCCADCATLETADKVRYHGCCRPQCTMPYRDQMTYRTSVARP
jgi:hypothetical protein